MNHFFETYTRGLTVEEFQRVFTRDAPDAYRFLSRGIDTGGLASLPWHKRVLLQVRLFFLAFTLKLTPARRALYALALAATAFGWVIGHRLWLALGFLLVNLLIILEVVDRFTLKSDLEVAREIQRAMLPQGGLTTADVDIDGRTRPANTVGGDFFDIVTLPDGRVMIALGDVAGKGSPAALLMALFLAMLRTLIDEQSDPAALAARLNVQIARQTPPSRFITLFLGVYDAATGRLVYVNAGQTPPLVRRHAGEFDRLITGGVALGMFEGSGYRAERTTLAPGEVLAIYSDGVTEAEDRAGRPFDEVGLERVLDAHATASALQLGAAVVSAVETYARATRLEDDLTILVLRRRAA